MTLVLDITIETADGLLEAVLAALLPLLCAGSLHVVLSKSFQKYGSLGLAKLTAGASWLIAAHGHAQHMHRALLAMNDALEWARSDDCQFLTMLLECVPDMETRFIHRAIDNAAAVNVLLVSTT